MNADTGKDVDQLPYHAWCRQQTLAPAANFLACSTPLAARLQKTSESFACSRGLLTATYDNVSAERLCLFSGLQATSSTCTQQSQHNINSGSICTFPHSMHLWLSYSQCTMEQLVHTFLMQQVCIAKCFLQTVLGEIAQVIFAPCNELGHHCYTAHFLH